ncbi:MAG: Na+/H+ antiporter NhaC family protein, partial [Fusobacteriaceae bacterium]
MGTITAIIKLSPVLVLAGLMMSGYDALLAAPLATVYAALVAALIAKKKIGEIIDACIKNAREMQIAFFILMMAYAMAEAFMAT